VAVAVPSDEDFVRLTEPYRRELLALCYRMLGSVDDAEDQVQETMLRAWRSYATFEGRSSLRTWLYKIATNACLRALEQRSRRPLPSGLGQPAEDTESPLATEPEVPWLQPIPDTLFAAPTDDPAAVVATRAGMRLALIAALQYLPPRQRAVLILRDVLGWRSAEVGNLIGTTTAAVNGALQRARAQLVDVAPAQDQVAEPTEAHTRVLLDRYTTAFAEADIAKLMCLLTEDAIAEMPPSPAWFTGREAIGRFLRAQVLGRPGDLRMIPTAGNGQPGIAMYRLDRDGVHRAHSIQLLTITAAGVAHVVSFRNPALFPKFSLPLAYPRADQESMPCRA
jgi:RNA polymerase sigma-70 factor (ECF subfamily)